MKKILLSLFLLLFLPLQAYAVVDEDHTLYLTIINRSDHTLEFNGVKYRNPGNEFSMDKNILLPGDATVLIAETVQRNDIWGLLSFSDELHNPITLMIRDPEQRNNVQPQFFMVRGKEDLISVVVGKPARNTNTGTRLLLYVEATIKVNN